MTKHKQNYSTHSPYNSGPLPNLVGPHKHYWHYSPKFSTFIFSAKECCCVITVKHLEAVVFIVVDVVVIFVANVVVEVKALVAVNQRNFWKHLKCGCPRFKILPRTINNSFSKKNYFIWQNRRIIHLIHHNFRLSDKRTNKSSFFRISKNV